MTFTKLEPFAWILMGGLLVWGYQAATAKKSEKAAAATVSNAQRAESIAAQLKAGPTTQVWNTPEGQLLQLQIPTAGPANLYVEQRNCLVWRDAATKTSALFCASPEPDIGDPLDPPDKAE
jgi:hypothetical protein